MLVLTVIVGAAGFFALTRLAGGVEFYRVMGQSARTSWACPRKKPIATSMPAPIKAMIEREAAYQEAQDALEICLASLAQGRDGVFTAGIQIKLQGAREQMETIRQALGEFHAAEGPKGEMETALRGSGAAIDALIAQAGFKVEAMHARAEMLWAASGAFLDRNTQQRRSKIEAALTEMDNAVTEYAAFASNSDQLRAIVEQIQQQLGNFKDRLATYQQTVTLQDGHLNQMEAAKKGTERPVCRNRRVNAGNAQSR